MAEDLDFEDNYARLLLCVVQESYSPLKGLQVVMKRECNNKFCRQKHLLNGAKWYETQAFRAVNQALGRCLRHRND